MRGVSFYSSRARSGKISGETRCLKPRWTVRGTLQDSSTQFLSPAEKIIRNYRDAQLTSTVKSFAVAAGFFCWQIPKSTLSDAMS